MLWFSIIAIIVGFILYYVVEYKLCYKSKHIAWTFLFLFNAWLTYDCKLIHSQATINVIFWGCMFFAAWHIIKASCFIESPKKQPETN